MTVAPDQHDRNPRTQNQDTPESPGRRPDLRAVADLPDSPWTAPEPPPEPPPAEYVTPQAPLDQRVLGAVRDVMNARPRWNERPPSPAETWDYSTSGDWTTSDNGAKRVFHGLCVLVAFAVTYPVDWAVQAIRSKPIGFVIAVPPHPAAGTPGSRLPRSHRPIREGEVAISGRAIACTRRGVDGRAARLCPSREE